MNRSAAKPLGHRGSPGSRRWRRDVAGALILTMLGGAGSVAQTIDRYSCVKESTERTIELHRSGAGERSCEVWYGAVGNLRRQAAAKTTPAACEAVVRKIRANLVNGGFTCDALQAREQPGGSVDAPRPAREDDVMQAGKAAVQRCLPRLHRIDDECEAASFKIRVVGEANTPMTAGGTDIPVLLVQAHSVAGTSGRIGGQYLVSQGNPATIRAVDQSDEDFGSAWSADLNDDGRTELMIFTRTPARRGQATSAFTIIGDARILGYAAASGASDPAHAVYVLTARTGGFRNLIALTGDAVFECRYRSGYQCRKLTLFDPERLP